MNRIRLEKKKINPVRSVVLTGTRQMLITSQAHQIGYNNWHVVHLYEQRTGVVSGFLHQALGDSLSP